MQTNRWMYKKLDYIHHRYYAYKVYKQIDGCIKSLAIFTNVTMHIKYTNKLMDVQKAWLYSLNRYYAYKVYKQKDGCTKSLAIFIKPLLCIKSIQTNRWMYKKLGYIY